MAATVFQREELDKAEGVAAERQRLVQMEVLLLAVMEVLVRHHLFLVRLYPMRVGAEAGLPPFLEQLLEPAGRAGVETVHFQTQMEAQALQIPEAEGVEAPLGIQQAQVLTAAQAALALSS